MVARPSKSPVMLRGLHTIREGLDLRQAALSFEGKEARRLHVNKVHRVALEKKKSVKQV
jgi:hypothetical protein